MARSIRSFSNTLVKPLGWRFQEKGTSQRKGRKGATKHEPTTGLCQDLLCWIFFTNLSTTFHRDSLAEFPRQWKSNLAAWELQFPIMMCRFVRGIREGGYIYVYIFSAICLLHCPKIIDYKNIKIIFKKEGGRREEGRMGRKEVIHILIIQEKPLWIAGKLVS